MLMILTAIIGIPLTVVAWIRGWKWRAIFPLPVGFIAEFVIGFFMGLILAGSGNLNEDSLMGVLTVGFFVELFIDLAVIGRLIFMVAKGRKEETPVYYVPPIYSPPTPIYNTPAPIYQPLVAAPAVVAPYKPALPALPAEPATVRPPFNVGKLVMPDNSEIVIKVTEKPIGRHDFDKIISPEHLKYVSRQHLLLKTDGNRYYVEDDKSSNMTKVNDVNITGKGKWELKDGDRIKLADVATMQFRLCHA